jgi:heme-degrading monooxygenase HmoA
VIAVIFEVWPRDAQRYLDIAADLRPLLDGIDGFLSIERFESLSEKGKFVSLSFWRDEAAVAQWRNTETHRGAQSEGRQNVLKDYRLRIAGVIRDYGMTDRGRTTAALRTDDHALSSVQVSAPSNFLTRAAANTSGSINRALTLMRLLAGSTANPCVAQPQTLQRWNVIILSPHI